MQHCQESSCEYTFEHICDPSLAQIPGSGIDGLKSLTKCLILILRILLGAYFPALLLTLN